MTAPTRNQCLQMLTRAVEAVMRDYDTKVTHFDIACVVYDALTVQGFEITRADTFDPVAMRNYVDSLMRSLGEVSQP